MKICVVGTGTMGTGIVHTLALAGFNVLQKGRSEKSLAQSKSSIEKQLNKAVEKGKMETAVKEQIQSRISQTLSYNDCKDYDFIIESISEDFAVKQDVFHQLDALCDPNTILATNTSSLSITALAAATAHPERVIGMHFFNPVPMMKLVEIIRGQLTANKTYETVYTLVQDMAKTPVSVNEAPGFVVNRILIPMINEAIGILADNVACKEEIDAAMKWGANHPMGPLELADLIGLDVCLAIMDVLYNEFGDPKYRAHPLLRKMVRANLLGRKTERGFYDYRKQ